MDRIPGYEAEVIAGVDELKELGWTQARIAAHIGIAHSTLSLVLQQKQVSAAMEHKVLSGIREMMKTAPLPPSVAAEPEPSRPCSTLDRLAKAAKLASELEAVLVETEKNCLPILAPGLREVIAKVRDVRRSVYID